MRSILLDPEKWDLMSARVINHFGFILIGTVHWIFLIFQLYLTDYGYIMMMLIGRTRIEITCLPRYRQVIDFVNLINSNPISGAARKDEGRVG